MGGVGMTAPPPSRAARPLTNKLAQLVKLAPDEIAILEELQSVTRTVRRNREILTEGQKYAALFVLIDGVSIRYRILHDGRRQILNIALPGTLSGFPAAFLTKRYTRLPRLPRLRSLRFRSGVCSVSSTAIPDWQPRYSGPLPVRLQSMRSI